METQLIISVVGLLVTILSFFFGLLKYFQFRIDKVTKERDEKINRVYERLDEYKLTLEEKFVSKDVCTVLHTHNAENFKRLEERMEAGFKDIKQDIMTLINRQIDK